jgi:hypothetical protein
MASATSSGVPILPTGVRGESGECLPTRFGVEEVPPAGVDHTRRDRVDPYRLLRHHGPVGAGLARDVTAAIFRLLAG